MHELPKSEGKAGPLFNESVFRSGLEQKISQWKAKWVTLNTGPMHIVRPAYDLVSESQREANRPEIEAQQELVEYCTQALRNAGSGENRARIVGLIKLDLRRYLLQESIAYDVLTEIFQAVVSAPDGERGK